jgi:hypothetical protein
MKTASRAAQPAASATARQLLRRHARQDLLVRRHDRASRQLRHPRRQHRRQPPYNIGGDGENPAEFSTGSRVPRSESQRYQVGANFKITDNITAYGEAKYVTEDTFDVGQPTFFDIDLVDSYGANETNPIYAVNNFDLRWSDNAFLPQNVKDAIRTNMVRPICRRTAGARGPWAADPAQNARHSLFGPDRTQDNTRDLQRYVFGVRGDLGDFSVVKDISFDVGYTYGKVEVENRERGVDSQRFALAIDSVVDTAGIVNGTTRRNRLPRPAAGQALNVANGDLLDYQRGGDLRDTAYGRAAIDECQPLNVFGKGNQSQAALDYVDATIHITEHNEQQQGIASISGNLWDFWGAGPIGVALGGEYRKESTSATGRDRDTAGRLLFLNGGPDFPEASYESKEVFAELSVPLFRDSFLGEYAELSGSYRYADYSTVGGLTSMASTWSIVRSRTSPSRPATTPRSACRTWARISRRTARPSPTASSTPAPPLNIAAVSTTRRPAPTGSTTVRRSPPPKG